MWKMRGFWKDNGHCMNFDPQNLQIALQSPRAAAVFTQVGSPATWEAQALAPDTLPLAGWTVAVKDNLDVKGQVTRAGSRVCADEPPAAQDAPAIARLRGAGAIFIGRTNMSEFAFSGVGINPHFGTPANPADPDRARIPGGSSSGSAVAVALGLARAGIGTDTGGSVRIPAALCGLVGYKATQARIPLQGVMELSRSLDTVGALTRNVADNLAIDAVLSGAGLPRVARPLSGVRLAVPQTVFLDDLTPAVAAAFARVLRQLSQAGAQIIDLPLREFSEVAPRSQPAGLSPVEGFAAHRHRLARDPAAVDPRVMARMKLGEGILACDYLGLLDRRREWIGLANAALAGVDALICPTVPMQAPELAPLRDYDEAFFHVNRLLLRNPSMINYWDGCAWSLPCHEPGELPIGLMLAAPHGRDAELAGLALSLEALVSPLSSDPPAHAL